MVSGVNSSLPPRRGALRASSPRGLVALSWLLGLLFLGTGTWKLVSPIPVLAAKMPWMGAVAPAFLRATAVLDVLVGLGALVPAVIRVPRRAAALGALGGVGLMVGALVFHAARGEAAKTPFNVVVGALALLLAWGRLRAAGSVPPDAPGGQ